jgi:hypothetical protein
MKRLFGTLLLGVLAAGLGGPARGGGDGDVQAVLDKAVRALGGKDKLTRALKATWKAKGTVSFGGMDNKFTGRTTADGLRHFRSEFEGDFGGNQIKGVTVVAADKGWRNFGGMETELDKDALANELRTAYLEVIPGTILPLGRKGFKVEAAGAAKVGGKPAVGVKVTPPDGKEFRLYFDKGTGLPVKLVAKVVDFMGQEFTRETTYHDYKDFKGVKRATHVVSKRDGEPFVDAHVTEFRVLDRVDPKTFARPE